ncbi:MAG: NADH-quinone oxidoreductase subunit D [bacterium]|jgi:NADH-quinone oxidoreductase subunit D|nr:NADH-quinone oxidoreductase subunit D [bacterium]
MESRDLFIHGSRVPDHGPDGELMILNMGPQHPSTHGVLRLELKTDGEEVAGIRPHIGYLHRCFEKHCEKLTPPQILPFTDRMDYLASMNNNLGFAIACERMLGLEVPEKVEYMRVIVAELNRIASHLVAIGTFGLDLGALTPYFYCFRDREIILDFFEEICGARLLYNYIWVGGLSHDFPEGMDDRIRRFCDEFERRIDHELNPLLSFNKIFLNRSAKIGVITPEEAWAWGLSGPSLRGSGVDFDLRRDDPYSIYDRFQWKVCVGEGLMGTVGDCWDRYWVKVLEMKESLSIIRQAIERRPHEGDVREKTPSRVKLPAGEIYCRTETPRGELGYYIVSTGGNLPERVKVRAPAFCNLSIIDEISRGALIGDVVAILGSLDIVLGEIDR